MVTESSEISVNNLLLQASRLTGTFDHSSWDVMALPPPVIPAVIKINPFGAEKKITAACFHDLTLYHFQQERFLGWSVAFAETFPCPNKSLLYG